ncbi:hypoxia-inducible factor 1-alpha-like [Dysidea avara]|uniref:hypoxia-inducible factor 1-alpha-like n=1 Tax=Dysidea avara TaxID=196820 RepID=UPI0033172890
MSLSPYSKETAISLGKMQDLMTEALDGFILVVLGDGTIVYVSDNIHKYLGLFQSEHIGTNVFDLILAEDHKDVKESLKTSEIQSMSRLQDGAPCSFFCRMKCPKFKMAMCAAKTPGYKLMYVSGQFKMDGSEPRLVAVVRPVSPPSILEIRMEGNMFVTHYQLDMRCTFFDGRLQNLLGYTKQDMMDKLAFDLHHHEDIEPCQKCHAGLLKRGEGVSGYYRMLNKCGQFIWCQTRAHMMFDSRSGKPSYIVCMNFIISKEKGEESLAQRTIEAGASAINDSSLKPVADHSYDPFPVTSNEWSGRDPFAEGMDTSARSSPDQLEPDSTTKSPSPPVASKSLEVNKSPSVMSTISSQDNMIQQSSLVSGPVSVTKSTTSVTDDRNISPEGNQSVRSMESGYESSIPTPQSAQLRNMTGGYNINSPVFQPETVTQKQSPSSPLNCPLHKQITIHTTNKHHKSISCNKC